jgi:hypothetical protein
VVEIEGTDEIGVEGADEVLADLTAGRGHRGMIARGGWWGNPADENVLRSLRDLLLRRLLSAVSISLIMGGPVLQGSAMNRSFHTSAAGTVLPVARSLVAVALVVLAWSCGRTIEEEEPRALVEHRIEPCEQWCTAQFSPECGRVDEQAFRDADECAEDCAAVDQVYAWNWARQADGTDGCAAEWIAATECIVALSCEEQRAFFRRPGNTDDYPCKELFDVKYDCFYSTPSLEREDD